MKGHLETAAWRFSSERAENALGSRNDFVAALHRQTGAPVDEFVAKVIYTELVSNVIRHAPGPIQILLERNGAEHWLHVFDRGAPFEWCPALPDDPFGEGGRGLFLISSYSQEVLIERPAGGGNVVRIRLKAPAVTVRSSSS
jgi:anti-sigma regulatory factor (Ser/Thr protein kinase)